MRIETSLKGVIRGETERKRPWQQRPPRTQMIQADRCDRVRSGDSQIVWAATLTATTLEMS